MPLFQRTIKLTLATCLAAALAYALGLTYAISAGVIAILSISDTRRSTIKQAYQRFMSTLLALVIGSIAFSFFGFNLWALGVFIALYVPCAFLMGWQIGITPSTVLVTHLLIEQSTSWGLLLNELALFLIGTSFALLANLYMPSNQAAIDHYHDVVEDQLKKILGRFAELLGKGDGRNDARLIKELDSILKDALNLVYLDHSNHCQLAASESMILAQLFKKTAKQLSQENPAQNLLNDITQYLAIFRERPLPKNREEFETRATLLQLLRDLETFIQVKVDFYQQFHQETE